MMTKIRYLPLTATPFKYNSVYQEISPCPVLRPYVRCFWGGESCCLDTETEESSEIVIPDACIDIMYRIDDEGYIITSDFIGINDRSFFTCCDKKSLDKLSVFAIRLNAAFEKIWNCKEEYSLRQCRERYSPASGGAYGGAVVERKFCMQQADGAAFMRIGSTSCCVFISTTFRILMSLQGRCTRKTRIYFNGLKNSFPRDYANARITGGFI